MLRRKRTIIAASAVVILIIAAVFIEAIISGRFDKSPLEQTAIEVNTEPVSQAEKVVIIEKEILITPTPAPPTPEPTPTPQPTPEPAAEPAPPAQQEPPQVQTQPEVPAPQPEVKQPEPEVQKAPEYERPQVDPEPPPPEPEPAPEVQSITLNAGSISIFAGDRWNLSVLSAPSSLTSQGGRWVTSNAAVADLSGQRTESVVIEGKSPGTATITIYSRDGQYSASCTVTVS